MKRTIENLRNANSGKIYIYLRNEEIAKQFMQDAENEGYKFGTIKPTENGWSDIVALEYDKQLSYAGFAGHMNFRLNGGDGEKPIRVDYEKYLNGCDDFIYEDKIS